MKDLEKKFIYILEKKFLFEKKPKIAVAVSGGPDSIALAFLLKKWIKRKKGQLTALIVNHQIRNDSLNEAKSVKKYLDINKFNSLVLTIPKKNISSGKMSQARNNRFEKLINFCNQNKIFHLFIGHHYDDNIETFFLRKIAGSNFEGLNCMKEKTYLKNVQILRPLLYFSKNQLISYNDYMKINYIFDPSNKNEKYSRILVRNFIKSNPKYLKNIQDDFFLIQNNYEDYMKMIYGNFIKTSLKIFNNNIVLDSNKFFNLDKEIQIKFIEIISRFLTTRTNFLRYKKISALVDKIQLNFSKAYILSKIKIERSGDMILFSSL